MKLIRLLQQHHHYSSNVPRSNCQELLRCSCGIPWLSCCGLPLLACSTDSVNVLEIAAANHLHLLLTSVVPKLENYWTHLEWLGLILIMPIRTMLKSNNRFPMGL
jgi:hypothetical protein